MIIMNTLHKRILMLLQLMLFSLLAASVPASPIGPGTGNLRLRDAMDTDGDGKCDLTVFRPETNTWYINKSGGGFTFIPFGTDATDEEVPGDFDGDGKGEI